MSSQPWRVKLRITTNGTGMLPSSVIPFLRSLWKNLSNSVSEIPFWCGGISAAVSLIPYLVNRNVSQVFLGKLCKRIRACYSPQPTVEFTSARLLRIPIIHFLPVGRNRPDVGYDVTMPHASLCETMHHAHSNHPSHSCIHTHTHRAAPGGRWPTSPSWSCSSLYFFPHSHGCLFCHGRHRGARPAQPHLLVVMGGPRSF
jgi:hypothetical protein